MASEPMTDFAGRFLDAFIGYHCKTQAIISEVFKPLADKAMLEIDDSIVTDMSEMKPVNWKAFFNGPTAPGRNWVEFEYKFANTTHYDNVAYITIYDDGRVLFTRNGITGRLRR